MPDATAVTRFSGATAEFKRFAVGQGYPPAVLWSSPASVLFWRRRVFVLVRDQEQRDLEAHVEFDAAVARNMGFVINGLCKTPAATVCCIDKAKDETDAEYKMIPASGVKMSVAVNPPPVVLVRNGVLWWMLKVFGDFGGIF